MGYHSKPCHIFSSLQASWIHEKEIKLVLFPSAVHQSLGTGLSVCACWLLAQAGAEVWIISVLTKEKEQSHLRKESYSLCYLCLSSPGPASLVKKSSVLTDYARQRNNFAFRAKYAINTPTNSSRLTLLKCSSKGGVCGILLF